MPSPSRVRLTPGCSLRLLERPHLYHRETDELYELDAAAAAYLLRLARGEEVPSPDPEFWAFCRAEGLLEEGPASPRSLPEPAPRPSLRYLELLLTDRCNLRCRHCYLGEPRGADLPFEEAVRLLDQFDRLGGLRLLLSGGEPLLHPDFWRLNELLPRWSFRSVLLTNGVLIDPAAARDLAVQEVQVSLDGLEPSHDALRGTGSFRAALAALEHLGAAGITVSVATMAHRGNRTDFPELARLLDHLGVAEWNVDAPAAAGRAQKGALLLSPQELAPLLTYSRGGGLHHSGGDGVCGTHLGAVTPEGELCKCGFYRGRGVPWGGDLRRAWEALPRMQLSDLSCGCPHLAECRGGCRFRAEAAGDGRGPDPVACARCGWDPWSSGLRPA